MGHALAAKRAFDFAKARGGTCLLRIEDIDSTRCKSEYTQAIYEDLRWLGFDWPAPVRVQSEHKQSYLGVLEGLRARGLIYRCFKNRKALPSGIYTGPETPLSEDETARRLAAGEPAAWRLSMARARGAGFEQLSYRESGTRQLADLSSFGDEVLARKDIGVSYHLACVHDDALQKITHVVRGADIAPLTPFHVLLQALMGWETPEYYHHDLLLRADGEKLSKRAGDRTIRSARISGKSAKALLAQFA
jgi:glutamyl-Q tRNA(Asp) synthetase